MCAVRCSSDALLPVLARGRGAAVTTAALLDIGFVVAVTFAAGGGILCGRRHTKSVWIVHKICLQGSAHFKR